MDKPPALFTLADTMSQRGKRTPGIRTDRIESFEILGRRIAHPAEAALGKEWFNLALINAEQVALAGYLRRPLHHPHLGTAVIAEGFIVGIVKSGIRHGFRIFAYDAKAVRSNHTLVTFIRTRKKTAQM